MRLRLSPVLLSALLVSLAACSGDGTVTQEPDAVDSTAVAADTVSAPAGTYRAYFVVSGAEGADTTGVTEGPLAAPIPASGIVSIPLPAHGDNIRVENTTWPLPGGLANSAYLLSYREPDGDLAVYATSFDGSRNANVDADTTDLWAVALAPMWAGAAPSHPLTVVDMAGGDSLTTFIVPRPTGAPNAHVMRLDGAGAAGQPLAALVLEVRWADGRARPVVLAYREQGGRWWASLMSHDADVVAAEGVQMYRGNVSLFPEHPMVWVAALDR